MIERDFEYELTEEIYLNARQNALGLRPLAILGATMSGAMAVLYGLDSILYVLLLLAAVGVPVLLLYRVARKMQLQSLEQARRTLSRYPHRKCRLRLSGEGVEFEYAFGRFKMPWECLLQVHAFGVSTVIAMYDGPLILVPTSLVDSELATFLRERSRINSAPAAS